MTKQFTLEELESLNNSVERTIKDYEYILEDKDYKFKKDIQENLKTYYKLNKKLIKEIQLATIGHTLT